MLLSIFAWVFRFGLFGIGNPGARIIPAGSVNDRLWNGI